MLHTFTGSPFLTRHKNDIMNDDGAVFIPAVPVPNRGVSSFSQIGLFLRRLQTRGRGARQPGVSAQAAPHRQRFDREGELIDNCEESKAAQQWFVRTALLRARQEPLSKGTSPPARDSTHTRGRPCLGPTSSIQLSPLLVHFYHVLLNCTCLLVATTQHIYLLS